MAAPLLFLQLCTRRVDEWLHCSATHVCIRKSFHCASAPQHKTVNRLMSLSTVLGNLSWKLFSPCNKVSGDCCFSSVFCCWRCCTAKFVWIHHRPCNSCTLDVPTATWPISHVGQHHGTFATRIFGRKPTWLLLVTVARGHSRCDRYQRFPNNWLITLQLCWVRAALKLRRPSTGTRLPQHTAALRAVDSHVHHNAWSRWPICGGTAIAQAHGLASGLRPREPARAHSSRRAAD